MQGGNVIPGFALVAQKEAGMYPSAYTVGQVLASLDRRMTRWLSPAQRPPFRVFAKYTNWVVAPCIGKVIGRALIMSPPGRGLLPAVIEHEDFDETKIADWVRGRDPHPECLDAAHIERMTIAQAEYIIGIQWQSSLQGIMSAWESLQRTLNPYVGPEEQEVDKHQQLRTVMTAMLKIMVTRSRDQRHPIPESWRPVVAKYDQFFAGRGRPRGSTKPIRPGK